MAGKTAILAIKIIADARAAAKGLDDTSTRAGRMAQKVSSAGRAAGKILAVGIAAAAVAAVKFARAAGEDAAGASKLAQTLQRAAGATKAQVAATEAYITKQGKLLGVSDDELRPALARLAAATHSVTAARKLASLAENVAAGTGKSLTAVSTSLAKGYNGSVAALSRLGISTKDAAGKTISFAEAKKRLSAAFGGAAKNAAATEAGQAKTLAVQYGELQEQIGAKLLPVMQKLVTAGLAVVNWISENQRTAGILIGVIVGLVAAVWAINAAVVAYTAVTKAIAAVTKIWTAVQAAFNVVMALNPVTLVVIAIVALVAIIVIVATKTRFFQTIWEKAWGAIKTAFSFVLDFIKANWPTILAILTGPIGVAVLLITKNWDKIKAGAKAVADFIKGALSTAFDALKTTASVVGDALLAPFKALWDLLVKIADKIGSLFGKVGSLIGKVGGIAGKIGGGLGIGSSTSSGPVSQRVAGPTVIIQGAIDPSSTAKQVNKILGGQATRLGRGWTPVRVA